MIALGRLLSDLEGRRAVISETGRRDEFVVSGYLGDTLDPPVLLVVSQERLDALAAAAGEDLWEVFPDCDLPTAAYRLLLVDLEECLRPSVAPVLALEVTAAGLAVTRAPVTGAPVRSSADLRWVPARERGVGSREPGIS